MSVQIKLWDVRVTKPVQEYKGHHNEHAYLPVHVNEREGLLLAGGRGSNTSSLLSLVYTFFPFLTTFDLCLFQWARIATQGYGA